MNTSCALVTGATSGLGLATALELVNLGCSPVIMTGRDHAKAKAAQVKISAATKKTSATYLALELNEPDSIHHSVAELGRRGDKIDLLILNAGIMSGSAKSTNEAGIEATFSATLTGHHIFTMALLSAQLLSPDAAIVISGSEAARGDVPMMGTTDIEALAADDFGGDLVAAAAAMILGEAPTKFRPNQTYADAKMFVAWWSAALARRLPGAMTVNAVSPGATPATEAGRHKGFVMRRLMMPMMSMMPDRMEMTGTTQQGARRYLDVATAANRTTGQFYASAPKKMHGPLKLLEVPRLTSVELQEAAWQAICETTSTPFPQ